MVIKWKKRNISILVLYVAAVSLLLTGVFGFAFSGLFSGSFKSCIRMLENSDFQETDTFKGFISDRLFHFLDMACGEYVNDYYYYGGGYYAYETTDIVEAEAIEQAAEQGYVLGEDVTDYAYSEDSEESIQKKLTADEKKALAYAFHKRIRSDKNILYRICYKGNQNYSNFGNVFWEYSSREKNLPEGYNFALYFDGKKAVIQKDGREVDIYGDGIYREEADWRLPGYKNYQGKDKWKDVEITILAAEEPVLYSGNDAYYGYWSENDFYYAYQNYMEERNHLKLSVGYFCLGLILLGCYLFVRKEKREAGKQFAKFTGRMWFEWKVLLFLVLPVILCIIFMNQNGRYGILRDYAVELGYADLPAVEYASEYFSEMSRYFFGGLWENRIGFLLAFWLLYLFVCDLCHNKGSYKKGAFGKLAAVLENRSLSLPLSKRIVKRSYGIIFLTIGQMGFFLIMLIFILVMGYRISWDESYDTIEWIVGMIFVALALTIALMVMEYIWQKKNRQFASDLEMFSNRISVIRDGNYYDEDVIAAEDADIRQMAAELEDIRKGLETAVEERTGSERMKVELVANVSHDIKTPLTSIISYIQLLKQEENLPDYVKDYIHILDEKSERLKNMVQDVFAVSKAASGQLHVEQKELDLGKLLYQTLADMEETIQNAPVTIKTEIPKEAIPVKSDGGRIYRVFQNLIGNAVKYSLEGSRVYISLKTEGNRAVASVKNTSSQELNQQTDFTERFVRGDLSRTDGGSGLGLSIAKSFTEACGGTFRLETIADLFVVTVSFQVLEVSVKL